MLIRMYTVHLWKRKLTVAYNDVMKTMLKMPRWCSACFIFILFDYLQSATRLALAAPAWSQTSALSVRRDSCWIQTRCCVAWRVTQTAQRGPTYTMTSSPAWVATGTVTLVRGRATRNARRVPSPDTFRVSFFYWRSVTNREAAHFHTTIFVTCVSRIETMGVGQALVCVFVFSRVHQCAFIPDSSCVSECPAGTYTTRQEADGKELGFCLPCDQACSKCTGASPRDCLACSSGYLHLLDDCVTHCPTGYTTGSSSLGNVGLIMKQN